jgi:pimeloyl-ACP methyl ester carboxylesterase
MADWLFDYMAADPADIGEHAREVYARAYSTADAVRAGNGWYRAFTQDIEDERAYGRVAAPILALGGDRSNYALLRDVLPSKGERVEVVEVADCGHYIPEEQPRAVIDALTGFLG